MTDEEFDQEFPEGSLKRQEELIRLEHERNEASVNPQEVPEAVWRAPNA
jgi:hypothetical protein